MSIVEKAVEKLKTLQPASPPSAGDDASTTPPVCASTVERSHERMHAVEPGDDATPLWHVDLDALRHAGIIPREAGPERRLTDELRRVKRPLLNNLGGKGAKAHPHPERIVVTSAIPGEGKTFTAMNLALSLAREPDFDVLLVDGDIPKANITRVLGLEDKLGMMDLLVDPTLHPADAIVRTDVPNLMVVPTGTRQTLTAELFGGKRMEHVLEAWGRPDRQRLLVFDSSPLLATSETQVLVSHMGQVVMIVAAARTRRHEIKSAMHSLNDSQHIGFILNKSRLPPGESHYYDDYYSNYYSTRQRREA